MSPVSRLTSSEICAGAGGQALGLERAGFGHEGAYELDGWAFQTLLANRPTWNPVQADVRQVEGSRFKGVDLFAGGVPCPPFSVAGRQLGPDDDRDLFPAALEWIHECRPNAVLLENVPGLASAKFAPYRKQLFAKLRKLGFALVTGLDVNASDYGVCQLRPRFLVIALRSPFADYFVPPKLTPCTSTVGELLYDLMSERGWLGASRWVHRANRIAPTLVGGSKLHGGPDLGPTRAKAAWRELGVDGLGLADIAPGPNCPASHIPKLTVRMAARIQGFPDNWQFAGRKTAQYRQVGNAFPPPVAEAVGRSLRAALEKRNRSRVDLPELFPVAVG
jgi:DNA (cytosine-5)-methyltransferase 1